METIEIKNAKITDTYLGYEDHGIFSCGITVEYGEGSCQMFGGYALDKPLDKNDFKSPSGYIGRIGTEYGHNFIIKILKTVGVEKWEDLKDKYIRVKASYSTIHEIGNLLEDKWFNPKEN